MGWRKGTRAGYFVTALWHSAGGFCCGWDWGRGWGWTGALCCCMCRPTVLLGYRHALLGTLAHHARPQPYHYALGAVTDLAPFCTAGAKEGKAGKKAGKPPGGGGGGGLGEDRFFRLTDLERYVEDAERRATGEGVRDGGWRGRSGGEGEGEGEGAGQGGKEVRRREGGREEERPRRGGAQGKVWAPVSAVKSPLSPACPKKLSQA